MENYLKQLSYYLIIVLFIFVLIFLLFRNWSSEEFKLTRERLNTWAEKLDRKIKPSGVYIQWESDTLPELDGWGTPIKIEYRNEGIAEKVVIKSAGRDKAWNTKDDLHTSRIQINGKGIGEGIKEHAGSISKNIAKETISGAKEGVSESTAEIKENVANKTDKSKQAAKKFLGNLKNRFKKDED